jgi:hypothetical protein
MEPEVSLSCSQEPTAGTYSDLEEFSLKKLGPRTAFLELLKFVRANAVIIGLYDE